MWSDHKNKSRTNAAPKHDEKIHGRNFESESGSGSGLEVSSSKKLSPMVSVMYSMIIAFVLLIGILVVGSPPNVSLEASSGKILGLTVTWLASTLLMRQYLELTKSKCWQESYVRFLIYSSTVGYWLIYFYVVLFEPINLCTTLVHISGSITQINCPSAIIHPELSDCVQGDFELDATRACTSGQVVSVPRNITNLTDGTVLDVFGDMTSDGQLIVSVVWVNRTNYNHAEEDVVTTALTEFPHDSILCGLITRPLCILPMTLPPFLEVKNDNLSIDTSTTWDNVIQFLSFFALAGFMGAIYIVLHIFRYCKRRFRDQVNQKKRLVQLASELHVTPRSHNPFASIDIRHK